MIFDEVRINDNLIIYNTDGGAVFSTDLTVLDNAFEASNQNWVSSRSEWNLGDRVVAQDEVDQLNTFFRARKGKFRGFRLKDWSDYTDKLLGVGCGTFATPSAGNVPTNIGVGTGGPTYQMYKFYASGPSTDYRMIQKPVTGTCAVRRNGSIVAATIDYTTGRVTFAADATSAATGGILGATTVVTTNLAVTGLLAGHKVHLSGFTGVDASAVNDLSHIVVSVTGTGPFTYTLATDTTALVITLGTGTLSKYPQSSDALTWTGEFDVPVRFDTDKFMARFDGANITAPGVVNGGYFYIARLPVIEARV